MTKIFVKPDGSLFTADTQDKANKAAAQGWKEQVNEPSPEVGNSAQVESIRAAQQAAKQRREASGSFVLPESAFDSNGLFKGQVVTHNGKLVQEKEGKNGPFNFLFVQGDDNDLVSRRIRLLIPIEAEPEKLVEGAIISVKKGQKSNRGEGFLFEYQA